MTDEEALPTAKTFYDTLANMLFEGMKMKSLLAVAVGATFGAWLRWGFSLWLGGNAFVQWGTLAANALGGLLMGVALALIQTCPQLSVECRLLLTTGFLGGLTTFSTFSAEAFVLLQRQQLHWLLAYVLLHVMLSIALTAIGYWLVMRWQA